MLKVKGFSYDTEKDVDVIEYIKKKPNGSQYVWGLVRKDMNKEEISKEAIEKIVQNTIEKYLSGMEIKLEEKSVKINTDEIMNILSM